MRWYNDVIIIFVIVLFLFADIGHNNMIVHAHSWYDTDCCNERDCAPAKVEHLPDGKIKLSNERGWVIVDPKIKPPRPSQDEQYHVCFYAALPENIERVPLCWYAPAGM